MKKASLRLAYKFRASMAELEKKGFCQGCPYECCGFCGDLAAAAFNAAWPSAAPINPFGIGMDLAMCITSAEMAEVIKKAL